jgi:peptidoglycan/LPS O-acetylase OafA/YrhL
MTVPQSRPQIDLSILDALRGLAALYVVAFHARTWLWSPAAGGLDGSLSSRASTALYDTFGFGPQAVLLFFLISGFCIHYRQARQLVQRGSITHSRSSPLLDLGVYARRRLLRLYPPLLIALAFTAVVDHVGNVLFGAFYAGQTSNAGFNTYLLKISDHSWWTLIGNLGFQANLGFHGFGTDTPLWSLSYEFWYYALYPVALVASARWGARGLLALVGTTSVLSLVAIAQDGTWTGACQATCSFMWIPGVLAYWIVWTIGALLAEAYVGRIQLPHIRLAAVVAPLELAVLAADNIHPFLPIHTIGKDLLWSAAFASILAVILLACPPVVSNMLQSASARVAPLGKVSYSLYLLHMPWLFLLSAWWLTGHRDLYSGPQLALVGIVSALGLSYVSWLLVERHFVSRKSESSATSSQAAPDQPTAVQLGRRSTSLLSSRRG